MENMEQLNLLTLSHDQFNVSSYTKLHCITEQLSDQNRGKTGNTCEVLVQVIFPRFMQFACFYSECSLAPRDVFLVLIGCCDCFSSGFKGSLEKRSTYVIPCGIKNTQSLIR